MPKPLSLCLERKGKPQNERYYKCTARTGREAGLSILDDGDIGWCATKNVVCDLYVSDDERLIAFCRNGSADVTVVRAGRSVALEAEKRAVLRHLDELRYGDIVFVVHKHGVAETVHPPRPVRFAQAAALAATLTVGGLQVACDRSEITGHRDPIGNTDPVDTETASSTQGDAGDPDTDSLTISDSDRVMDSDSDSVTDSDTIEIRDTPPIK